VRASAARCRFRRSSFNNWGARSLAKFRDVPKWNRRARFQMSARKTNDPEHWHKRAAQMRSLAIKMAGSDAAILMNDLAIEYDSLAERAAIRANGKKPSLNGQRAKPNPK
jgi:hypothetical protein